MIEGKVRETTNFETTELFVGLAECKVVAINPDSEKYTELTGKELKEDSKATEYLGESKDGNTSLRLDFWLEEVKTKNKFKQTFFLEDKKKENKVEEGDGKVKKFQYKNESNSFSWADDPNNLLDWFKAKEYRVAYVGEEELYGFINNWLGKLDKKTANIDLEWKKLMKGNIKVLTEQINAEFDTTVVVPLTIKTVDKDGETKEYQNVYNKSSLPAYLLKFFRLTDYTKDEERAKLEAKDPKKLDWTNKTLRKFILGMYDSTYGCKDFFVLKDMAKYDPNMNIVSGNKVLQEDDPSY